MVLFSTLKEVITLPKKMAICGSLGGNTEAAYLTIYSQKHFKIYKVYLCLANLNYGCLHLWMYWSFKTGHHCKDECSGWCRVWVGCHFRFSIQQQSDQKIYKGVIFSTKDCKLDFFSDSAHVILEERFQHGSLDASLACTHSSHTHAYTPAPPIMLSRNLDRNQVTVKHLSYSCYYENAVAVVKTTSFHHFREAV